MSQNGHGWAYQPNEFQHDPANFMQPQLHLDTDMGDGGQAYDFNSHIGHQSFASQGDTPGLLPGDPGLADIQQYVRPTDDSPWAATYGVLNQPTFPLQMIGPRAATVAVPHFCGDPPHSGPGRPSFGSAVDSGFYESSTLPGVPEEDLSLNTNACGSRTRGPGSVRSAPEQRRSRAAKKLTHRARCSFCGKESMSRSEATKHRQQHEKPFRCNESDCNREQGFSTNNDLERHRKSVHGLEPLVGEKGGYTCVACQVPNNGAPKWWPRLDNFKAHVLRKHPKCDVDTVIRQSHRRSRPSDSGYGGSRIHDADSYRLLSPHPVEMSRHNSSRTESMYSSFGEPTSTTLAGIGTGQTPGVHSQSDYFPSSPFGSDYQLSAPSSAVVPSALLDDHFQMIGPRTLVVPCFAVAHEEANYGCSDGSTVGPSNVDMRPNRIEVKQTRTTTTDATWKCPWPGCDKYKRRECDLRKHTKRHTRPYGCTFANCDKKLGSRNDWKRHENSQHQLFDTWLCPCMALFNDRASFAVHLEQIHGFPRFSQQNESLLEGRHLGKDGHYCFWCGFCKLLIPQDEVQAGVDSKNSAWEARSKHIGDHFDKDGFTIDRWQWIEPHQPRQKHQNQSTGGQGGRKKPQKRTTKSQTSQEHDESDLEDDCIAAAGGAYAYKHEDTADYSTTLAYYQPGELTTDIFGNSLIQDDSEDAECDSDND